MCDMITVSLGRSHTASVRVAGYEEHLRAIAGKAAVPAEATWEMEMGLPGRKFARKV
jgi:hypothetical protein